MRTVPLTNLSGQVWTPAFSPDARQIAFFWDGENPGKGDLYVQLVGGDRPLRLTHTLSGSAGNPAWSPDGSKIAFGRCDENNVGGIYIVPALGGPERKVTEVACPGASPNWTSDGRSLVIADKCAPSGALGIVVSSLETGVKRCLTNPPLGEDKGDLAPVLSPDQKTVAFLRVSTTGISDVSTVALEGGSPRRLTLENKQIAKFMWTADGRSITFLSTRGGLLGIWRVSAAGGAIEAETLYSGVGTLSRDGKRLAYVRETNSSAVWRAELSEPGGPVSALHPLLSALGDSSPQPSPDGREVAFQSLRSGSGEIWKCNADGSDPIKLTSFDGFAGTPRWSPDGRWIAFDYRPSAYSQIFVIDEEGRNLHMITSGKGEYENVVPSWSRDGKAIYFASNRTGDRQIWRHDLATGQEAQVTHRGGFASFESYDGKRLYFSKFNIEGIWIIPVAGGEEERLTDAPHRGYLGHFAVIEDGLYLVDSNSKRGPTIMYFRFQTRELTPLLTLPEGQNAAPWSSNLSATRDGRTVFFVEGTSTSSIVMANNIQ